MRGCSSSNPSIRWQRLKTSGTSSGGWLSALAEQIRDSVKTRLAAYEYPREIEFIDTLPMTTTGKVRRVELRRRARAEAHQGPSSNPLQGTD